MCCKRGFDSRRKAEEELEKIEANRWQWWRQEKRVYFCWQCQAWHLSSLGLTDPSREETT